MSSASNLIRRDFNDRRDVFVYNRRTGGTHRVSVSGGGREANEDSLESEISADGRYVVFESLATNLVPGDTDEIGDVFIFDRERRTTRLVTRGTCAEKSNAWSLDPSVSAHGRFVAFTSTATNLVSDDAEDEEEDVYVRDMAFGC